MSSYYQTKVVYPAALEEAFISLAQIKRSLDAYKLKENANQKYIKDREEILAKLMQFIDVSKETFQILMDDYSQARAEGYRSGYNQAEKDIKHKEDYGNLSFHNSEHKERIRAATILNAQLKWDF